jgi:hypothetical protein
MWFLSHNHKESGLKEVPMQNLNYILVSRACGIILQYWHTNIHLLLQDYVCTKKVKVTFL